MKKSKQTLIHEHYEPLVRPGARNHEMLDWGSKDAQIARFQVLADCLEINGLLGPQPLPSLLDVGCGITDLQTFFEAENIAVDYTGVDITPAILDQARLKHPGRKILQANIFDDPPFQTAEFDVVFCSGTLNLRLGNNDDFSARALAAMLKLTGKLLVVNFLHERTRKKYDQCFYYSPDKILKKATELAPPGSRLCIFDNYLENDFTLEIKI